MHEFHELALGTTSYFSHSAAIVQEFEPWTLASRVTRYINAMSSICGTVRFLNCHKCKVDGSAGTTTGLLYSCSMNSAISIMTFPRRECSGIDSDGRIYQ